MSENSNYESGQQTSSTPSERLEAERRGGGTIDLASARNLFRIGEVSRIAETKPFVLRYWETEFPMLQPVKSAKGHRLYRQEDVDTVLLIKRLLYDEGFTIAGARRHLREGDAAAAPDRQFHPSASEPAATISRESATSGAPSPSVSATRQAPAEHPAENLLSEHLLTESRFAESRLAEHGQILSGGRRTAEAPVVIDRKVLLDLRDALRSFLTLLETE